MSAVGESGLSWHGRVLPSLTKANLSKASLLLTNLRGANLIGANLSRAYLIEANLTKADLGMADLTKANLRGANLSGARLFKAILVNTDLTGANLTGCSVHGVSAWELKLENAKQYNLVITNSYEPEITVVARSGGVWTSRAASLSAPALLDSPNKVGPSHCPVTAIPPS
jgi:uncharacterized protein YjbI with pentapeptide repeats